MKKDSHPQKTSAPASPPSTILDFREYVLVVLERTNYLLKV